MVETGYRLEDGFKKKNNKRPQRGKKWVAVLQERERDVVKH